MNKLIIIGNLSRDPEMRTTQNGITLCTFTVAVNRRHRDGQEPQQADFFRVTAWRQLGDLCQKYLKKGRKVCVIGSVSVSAYKAQDGTARANLDVTADEVEFLSPKEQTAELNTADRNTANAVTSSGFVEVDDEELPF